MNIILIYIHEPIYLTTAPEILHRNLGHDVFFNLTLYKRFPIGTSWCNTKNVCVSTAYGCLTKK